VHRIQGLRRAANFEVTDHIETWYDGPVDLAGVMRGNFSAYIREETLSDVVEVGPPPEGAKSESAKIEGQEITLAVRRV
jgi:isoleucyl-tRNA synthetase